MARPRKEGMDYFPHDTDAVNDEKLEALRALFGNDGYAFYFILLERIYRTSSFELDVSDAETIQILSKKISVTEELFVRMLEAALKRGCFDRHSYDERKVLTSSGIKKRASVVIEKRESMRSKYQSEQEEQRGVPEAEITTKTEEETPQSKVKKSKVKNSKEKNSKEKIISNEVFELLWTLYPKKEGKGQISNTQKDRLCKIGIDEMTRAVNRYIKAKKGKDKQYLQNGSTFFNSGYVDYLDVNYEVDKLGGEQTEDNPRDSRPKWETDPYLKQLRYTHGE